MSENNYASMTDKQLQAHAGKHRRRYFRLERWSLKVPLNQRREVVEDMNEAKQMFMAAEEALYRRYIERTHDH